MTAPTDAELLEKVKEALGGTLDRNAASITIAGRTLGSLRISELIALRNDLERRIAIAAGKGRSAVVRFQDHRG